MAYKSYIINAIVSLQVGRTNHTVYKACSDECQSYCIPAYIAIRCVTWLILVKSVEYSVRTLIVIFDTLRAPCYTT